VAGDFDWTLPNGGRRQPWELLIHERLLAWDLAPRETVIVIGGYSGAECQMILDRYPDVDLYTFEPQLPFYNALLNRFARVPNVHVYPYGLGDRSGTFDMTRAGTDRASLMVGEYAQLGESPPDSHGELREWGSVMASLGIAEIGLLHSNIEQYEYVLFPHLYRAGWLPRIAQVVVQVHPFPNIETHPDALPFEAWAAQIEETHTRRWESGHGAWYAWALPDRRLRDVLADMQEAGIEL
jgi:FkbM family methyltransferase